MSAPASILIENVYYMLAYAFKVVDMRDFKKVASEKFDNAEDLLSAILTVGVKRLVREGFFRSYKETFSDDLNTVKGQICFSDTIRNIIARRQKLSCTYDIFSVDNLFNQILKTTIEILLKTKQVHVERKRSLRQQLPFFDGINAIDPTAIQWSQLHYQRNNRSYLILMNLCRLIIDGCIMGDKDDSGNYKLQLFSEDRLCDIYEAFLREYYKVHRPDINVLGKKTLNWDATPADRAKLPKMETDVMLKCGGKILIIDAKFLGKILQYQFGGSSYKNANIYQITTYVTSAKADPLYSNCAISGMLLYAKTDECVRPSTVTIGGNKVSLRTLDLNAKFVDIAAALDAIIEEWKQDNV